MSIQEQEVPELVRDERGVVARAVMPVAGGIVVCLFLAIAQVAIAGYQLGVGNQGIQIAFLKRLADPTLFGRDAMVTSTLPLYPSYFFRLLAPLARAFEIEPLYLILHVLTGFLTLSGVYVLGRALFRSHWAALVGVVLLVAGHHQALAGDGLYSTGFTHTYAALPLALAALALAFTEGRYKFLWAFAVAGLLFNFHALTGAYAMGMLGAALLADAGEMPVGLQVRRAMLCAAAAFLVASPTLVLMLGQHQVFTSEWVNLMRIRSAEHSFPSTWWSVGNPDLPRFAMVCGLFVLSWSFLSREKGQEKLRMTLWMTGAVVGLFVVGYVFSEVVPVPVMIRLQPFRASRLLELLMFVWIGHGVICGMKRGTVARGFAWGLEIISGVVIVGALAVPGLILYLPVAVVLAVVAAIVSGRLSWVQALIVAGVMLVVLAAYVRIEFALPFVSAASGWGSVSFLGDPLVMVAVAGAIGFGILFARVRHGLVVAAGVVCAMVLAGVLFNREMTAPAAESTVALESVSHWAETHTAKDAVFLAPSGLSNFRILAERGLVADWRDGTQLYFSGAFAGDWFKRLTAIEPGIILSPGNMGQGDAIRLIARGKSLDSLDTEALVGLAKTYGANYILLPTPAGDHSRALQAAYADAHYTVYLASPPVPTPAAVTAAQPIVIPKGVIDPKQWVLMEKFMNTTVQQNIDTYRKAALTVKIVDGSGKPVTGLPVILEQKSHAFNFGVSLGFFVPNDIDSMEDQKPNVVTPKELQIAPTIFNASMMAFSSKWLFVEPERDKPDYRDLDKYVEYCTRNHMAMEYHFLSGLPPRWIMGNYQEQIDRYPDHVRNLLARYGDRIKYWQLTNEGRLMAQVPAIFKEMKAKYPNVKLGIADCVKFGSYDDSDEGSARADMYKGFQYVPWLKTQGVQLDYFGIHGHRPFGLWADPRVMYEVMDTVAKQKVKVHITEMLLPLNDMIIGPVMRGRWTPQTQADFLERYLTVCFSHPACELVNFWGLTATSWGDSAGLLDMKQNPRPALTRIAHLINDVWHTRLEESLGDDGAVKTRAFHGGYELSVTTSDGRTVKMELDVPAQPVVGYTLKLDAEKGTLSVVEGPGAATEFPAWAGATAEGAGGKRSMSGKPLE